MSWVWNGTTNQNWSTPDLAAMNGATAFTVLIWLRFTSSPGSNTYIVMNDGSILRFRHTSTNMEWLANINGVNRTITYADTSHPTGTDVCCVLRFTGSELRAYANGTEVGTGVTGLTGGLGNTSTFFYGSNPNGSSPLNSGRMAECAIWTRALSDAEIASLVAGTNPQDFAPDQLYMQMQGDKAEEDWSPLKNTITVGVGTQTTKGTHMPVSIPTAMRPLRVRRSVLLRR